MANTPRAGRRGPFAHLDLDQREYLAGLDDETIACKGGGRHPFPSLIPGRPLPKGVSVRPAKQGRFQLTETCPVCGRQRRKLTAPRGFLGAGIRGAYSGGQAGYIAKGLGLTHADHANELGRRLQETILEAGEAGCIMRELQLRLFDDLNAVTGMRTEAVTVRRLVLDGREVELDLTQEHADELDDLLAPYFQAGQQPEKAAAVPGGSMAARNEYNEQMRKFSDKYEGHGEFKPYRQMDKGGYYYPKSLQAAFAAYMATHAA